MFSLIWLSLVYADVRLGVTFTAVDSPAVGFGVILVTAVAVWILARKSFAPKKKRDEIKIIFASLVGTVVWLICTILLVIQFHLLLGGSL
jgi:hypothetical protein